MPPRRTRSKGKLATPTATSKATPPATTPPAQSRSSTKAGTATAVAAAAAAASVAGPVPKRPASEVADGEPSSKCSILTTTTTTPTTTTKRDFLFSFSRLHQFLFVVLRGWVGSCQHFFRVLLNKSKIST